MHPALNDLADRLLSVTTDLHALALPACEAGGGSDTATGAGSGSSFPCGSDKAASPMSATTTPSCEPGLEATPGSTAGVQLADWVALVSLGQRAINQLNAFLDTAMVRVAAHEVWVDEDGLLVETDRGDGHVSLDAADIVAGPLGLSHVGASQRLEQAVRLVADRCPVTGEPAGLGGLRAAMTAGTLDGWRAQVVTDELRGAPAPVARAVVAALGDALPTRAAGALRKRVRTVLARISPDLLRERAEAARRDCGLRRSVGEPGTDCWWAVFPSEQAATAWAVVDALAQRIVNDAEQPPTIDAARGQALLDLINGRATIDIRVQLTVPAETLLPPDPPSTLTSGQADAPAPDQPGRRAGTIQTPGQPENRARATQSPGQPSPSVPSPPADRSAAAIGADPVGPSLQVKLPGDAGQGLVQVSFGRSEPALVAREWLTSAVLEHGYELRRCHPGTGALVDEGSTLGYRPSAELAALVRARDGRCRFPGCSINARFCDLDHVIPWPLGPTAATNLATLCRRHHRIKQRPGWRAMLHPDATMTWIDPTGQVRDSSPLDHLHGLTLPSGPSGAPPTGGHGTRPDPATSAANVKRAAKAEAFSRFEFELEHAIEAAWREPIQPTAEPAAQPATSPGHTRGSRRPKPPPRHWRRLGFGCDIVHGRALKREVLVSFGAVPRSGHPIDPGHGADRPDEAPPF